MRAAIKILGLLAGALVGAEIGSFFPGVMICNWLISQSNLCGQPAVVAGPLLGIIAGAVIGWHIVHLPPMAIKILATLAGAVVGSQIGSFFVVLVLCGWLMSGSNLCGLPAVVTGLPLGAIVGALIGWRIARPYTRYAS